MQITTVKDKAISDFLSHYKSGHFVYPQVLKRNFGIELGAAHEILFNRVNNGTMQAFYEVYCPICYQDVDGLFDDVPNTAHCEECGDFIVENASIIYKMK